MEDQTNNENPKFGNGEEFLENVTHLLNHKELSDLLKLFRHQKKWTNLIETGINEKSFNAISRYLSFKSPENNGINCLH